MFVRENNAKNSAFLVYPYLTYFLATIFLVSYDQLHAFRAIWV